MCTLMSRYGVDKIKLIYYLVLETLINFNTSLRSCIYIRYSKFSHTPYSLTANSQHPSFHSHTFSTTPRALHFSSLNSALEVISLPQTPRTTPYLSSYLIISLSHYLSISLSHYLIISLSHYHIISLSISQQNNLIVGDIASRDIVKGNEIQITILLEQLRAAYKRKVEVISMKLTNLR
jgi:hypothetical protein